MFPTGIRDLDVFLGGGITGGMITDVYGPAGSGKTQVLMQVSARAAVEGRTVVYVDAAGGFRPERMLQMGCAADALQNILVFRAMNVSEQAWVLGALPQETGLLVVDGVTELFAYEYAGRRAGYIRNRQVMKHMRHLAGVAVSRMIPVVVSNTVRYTGESETESVAKCVDLYTHTKVYLSGRPRYTAWCRQAGLHRRLVYFVGGSGVRCPTLGQEVRSPS